MSQFSKNTFVLQVDVVFLELFHLHMGHFFGHPVYTECPKKKVSIKSFNSDLLITLIQSFQTSLDTVGLYVLLGV